MTTEPIAIKSLRMDREDLVTVTGLGRRLTKHMEEVAFRQWSDKGYVHCRVTILVGTCDNCGFKSLDPGSNKLMDEAVQREYDKLP